MSDLQLLFFELLKLAVVVGVMALVIAAPSGASAAAAGTGQEGAPVMDLAGSPFVWSDDAGPMRREFGRYELFSSECDVERMRSTDTSLLDDDWDHHRTGAGLYGTDPFEHTMNIDGTPMFGDTDIKGNAYGVTDW